MRLLSSELCGFTVKVEGEASGTVCNIYFDSKEWGVRYLSVEMGSALDKQTILVTPHAISGVDADKSELDLSISMDQINKSPKPELRRDLALGELVKLHDFYQWPVYWTGMGTGAFFGALFPIDPYRLMYPPEKAGIKEPNATGIKGYMVKGLKHKIGRVRQLVINVDTWKIEFVIIKARALFGKKYILNTSWIRNINWYKDEMQISLPRDILKKSPRFRKKLFKKRREVFFF